MALVARVVTGLRIPPILLGFGDSGITVGQAGVDGLEVVSWVDRRDFVQHVAALTLGATGVARLDIDRLTALLPHADPTGIRHVGAADVEVIEQATAAFVRQDFAPGAGPIRDVAVAQLRSVLHFSTPRPLLRCGLGSTWTVARAADHPQGSDLCGR